MLKKNDFHLLNILSIDYGEKVIGLASIKLGRDPYPTPFGKIINKNSKQVQSELKKAIEDEFFDAIVFGVPLHSDGTRSEMTEKIELYGKSLSSYFEHIPFYFQDESFTTYEAMDRMKNSAQYNFKVDPKQIDALSAAIILEDFLKKLI